MALSATLDRALQGERLPLERIPIVDLGPLFTGDLDARHGVAAQIGDACRDIGFFYVRNHGVAPELVQRTFDEAARFFALPVERKRATAIENSPCHRGYFALGGENLDPKNQTADGDFKEGVKIGRDLGPDHALVEARLPLHGPNQWPDLPGWRGAMQAYYDQMVTLGRQLMRAFALALDVDECHFDRMLTDPMTTLGPLHYPPQTGPITERQLGAGAHTDFGCLTILAQDEVGGLQVRNAAGQWIDAPYVAGTFVINIGDMMARWTNDLFASTQHRVINSSGRERYSLPFFMDPNYTAEVVALPTCVGPDRPARYAPTTSGQHLLDMINATFDYQKDSKAGA